MSGDSACCSVCVAACDYGRSSNRISSGCDGGRYCLGWLRRSVCVYILVCLYIARVKHIYIYVFLSVTELMHVSQYQRCVAVWMVLSWVATSIGVYIFIHLCAVICCSVGGIPLNGYVDRCVFENMCFCALYSSVVCCSVLQCVAVCCSVGGIVLGGYVDRCVYIYICVSDWCKVW